MDDILVATDELDHWSGAVNYAARLAAHVGAQLTATYILPPPGAGDEFVPAPLAAEIVDLLREQAERAVLAGSAFARWAAARGVPASAWHMAEGDMGEVLAAAAKWHDALVLARGEATPWTLAGRLLLTADIPCIVLPPTLEAPRFDTLAIAWDGSLHATRALHAAMPLLRRAAHVVLIDGAVAREEVGHGELDPYLREHGLNVTRLRVAATPGGAGAEILAAAEASADLLIMGAWGRTRLGEWMFGGATRHVLENARIPVLMRH